MPTDSEVIFKFSNNFNNIRCGLGNGSGAYVTVWYKNPSSYQGHNYTYMYNTNPQTLHETVTNITADDEISVKIQNGVATWYKNGVQQDSSSIPSNTMNIRFVDSNNFTPTYVKVKPL